MKLFRFNSDNLDETLFEHRNKEYGAYELRKSYDARLIKSFFISLSLLFLLFGSPFIIQHLLRKPVPPQITFHSTKVDLDKKFEIEEKKDLNITPLKPSRQNATAIAPLAIIPDSLLSKNETKKDTATQLRETNSLANNNTGSTGSDTTGTIPEKKGSGGTETTTWASSTPFNAAVVEKIPQFSGGESALMTFLQKNIRYNQVAKEAGVTGRVYASFIVNSKGEVEAVKILRGLGYGLDEEVLRVLGGMPRWEPGYFQGKAVSTIMNIPVSFSLLQ